MKRNTRFLRFMYKMTLICWLFNFALYILLTPLRLLNALYYNIVVYVFWNVRDHISDIFNPKNGKWQKRKGVRYFAYWLFGLPLRIIRYGFTGILQLTEGVVFTVIDIFVPTLTMKHGTSYSASISISKPGEKVMTKAKWLVGSGNYAGTGIYFTMDTRVADYYARAGTGNEPMIVYARVSLGKNVNLSMVPKTIYSMTGGRDGNGLSHWGINNHITSFEWWRRDQDAKWWEYVLLYPQIGEYITSWRIRILYIHNLKTYRKERVWGGKALWLFSKDR